MNQRAVCLLIASFLCFIVMSSADEQTDRTTTSSSCTSACVKGFYLFVGLFVCAGYAVIMAVSETNLNTIVYKTI